MGRPRGWGLGDRQEIEREKGEGWGSGERGTEAPNNENDNKPANAVKTNPQVNNYGTAIETTHTDHSTLFLTNIDPPDTRVPAQGRMLQSRTCSRGQPAWRPRWEPVTSNLVVPDSQVHPPRPPESMQRLFNCTDHVLINEYLMTNNVWQKQQIATETLSIKYT